MQLTAAVNVHSGANIKALENRARDANVGNANLKRQLTRANKNGMSYTQRVYFESLLTSNVLYVLTFCTIALRVINIIKPYHNTVKHITPGQENVVNIEAFAPLLILQVYLIPGLLRGLMLLSSFFLNQFRIRNAIVTMSQRSIGTNLVVPAISAGLSYFIFNVKKTTIQTLFRTLRDAYVKTNSTNQYKKRIKWYAQFSWIPGMSGTENARKRMVNHSTNWIKILSNQQALVAKTSSILITATVLQLIYSIVSISRIFSAKKKARQQLAITSA
jgi:hypothetical protein